MVKSVLAEEAKLHRIQRGHFSEEEAAAFKTIAAFEANYPATTGTMTPLKVEMLLEKMQKVVNCG